MVKYRKSDQAFDVLIMRNKGYSTLDGPVGNYFDLEPVSPARHDA